MKAYSYIRWSSEIQSSGDSLTRQLEATRKICAERNWELDEGLKPDEGLSGFTGSNIEKGSLGQFLTEVAVGKIKTPCVLVVEQLDRLTRTRLRDARKLFDGLLEKGVKICTAHNGKLYDDKSLDEPMDLFMSLMEMKAAHDYSANLGRRVASARQREREAAAKDKKIWTKIAPAWLDVDKANNKFIINKRVEIIRHIFRDYVNGKGIRRIVWNLNDDDNKVPAFRSKKGWSPVHVKRILSSRSVLGEYQPMKHISKHEKKPACDPIPNFYPQIIDTATFHRAQQRLASNRESGGPRKGATNIFTGLLKCSHCGGSMVIQYNGNKKKGYKQNLACSNAIRGNGCPLERIRYSHVERAILTVLWSKFIPVLSERDDRPEKLIGLQGELKDANAKLGELQAILTENPSKTGAKSAATLESKIEELTKQIENLSAVIQDNPLTGWQQIEQTTDNRLRLQAILANEIKIVEIDAGNKRAILETKSPEHAFEILWQPKVSNAAKKDPASEGFVVSGAEFTNRQLPYLDHRFVWKNEGNPSLDWVWENMKLDEAA